MPETVQPPLYINANLTRPGINQQSGLFCAGS